MTSTRWTYLAIGLAIGAAGGLGLRYLFNPGFLLEPQPGFEASIAVIALVIAARLIWIALAPDQFFHRRRR